MSVLCVPLCAVGGAGAAMEDDDLSSAIALSMGTPEGAPLAAAGLPPTFKGVYELFAVVTHQGRSADAGHYIGWVRAKGGTTDGCASMRACVWGN